MPPRGAEHGAVSAGDSERARLGVQSIIERFANGPHAPARAALRLEDDDRQARLMKKIGGAQSREAGADDHNRIGLSSGCAGAECERCQQKLPAVHGKPNAMMLDPAATATYCLLSNTYVIGDAFHSALV